MANIRNLDKLIAERSANAALSYDKVTRVIRAVIKSQYPEIKNITSVTHETYKRRVGQHHSAFNYGYTIRAVKNDGTPTQLLLIYSAHTDGSRAYAFKIMHLLIAAGFNDTQFKIIRPLEYRDDLQALIYEGTPGKKLLWHMEHHASIADLSRCAELVASWIKKFHSQKLTPSITKAVHAFNWQDMNTPLQKILTDVQEVDAAQGEKLEHFMSTFGRLEAELSHGLEKNLVYGDLHPENIIVPEPLTNDLTMIDFTDVTIGDPFRDIGTFIQQLRFMGKNLYSDADLQTIILAFLRAYFGKPFEELKDTEHARINLFQAWNALRSFVYFFYLGNAQVSAYGLLEDAWRYLYLAEHREPSLSIIY